MIVREMLRLVDGRPHNLARWVFPSWLASSTKLTLPGSIPEGSVPYLAGIGFGPDSYEVQIEARMPDRAEAGVLAIPAGVPVLAEYRTGTAAGRAVFCSVTVWPGDRARLLLDVPVDLPGEGCER